MSESAFWQGRRVLVTGCTGLIGTALVRELLRSQAVVAGLIRDQIPEGDYQLDPIFRKLRVIRGRVEDRFRIQTALAIHGIQSVFHLASSTDAHHSDTGTISILAAIQGHDPRITFVTAQKSSLAGDECSALLKSNRFGIPWGVAEFGEVFGPGDRRLDRLIPRTILSYLRHREASATTSSSLVKDFVYSVDAARACMVLSESLSEAQEGSRRVVFRSGWVFSENQMKELIHTLMSCGSAKSLILPTLDPNLMRHPDDVGVLGWLPTGTLAERLRETIRWYQAFPRKHFWGTDSSMLSPRAAA